MMQGCRSTPASHPPEGDLVTPPEEHGPADDVLGDVDLLRDVERHFLQRVLVGDALDEGHDELEARRERAVVLAELLDDVLVDRALDFILAGAPSLMNQPSDRARSGWVADGVAEICNRS